MVKISLKSVWARKRRLTSIFLASLHAGTKQDS